MRMGWHLLAFMGIERFLPCAKTIKIIGFYWHLSASASGTAPWCWRPDARPGEGALPENFPCDIHRYTSINILPAGFLSCGVSAVAAGRRRRTKDRRETISRRMPWIAFHRRLPGEHPGSAGWSVVPETINNSSQVKIWIIAYYDKQVKIAAHGNGGCWLPPPFSNRNNLVYLVNWRRNS
jgi:hypothetical protein